MGVLEAELTVPPYSDDGVADDEYVDEVDLTSWEVV